MIRLALADDHELIRKGIAEILLKNDLRVVADAGNGKELIEKLQTKTADVVLMDINMPVKDGIKTTAWLRTNMPATRVIALSVLDDEVSVIRMLKAGARGYLVKNSKPKQLIRAIHDVHEKGYHFSDMLSSHLVVSVNNHDSESELEKAVGLTERDVEFLKHCCSEMTNKEIGALMNTSPRTAEWYSTALCAKLGLKSRVGLVLYALKNHIVSA